jgi:hypothetical protein
MVVWAEDSNLRPSRLAYNMPEGENALNNCRLVGVVVFLSMVLLPLRLWGQNSSIILTDCQRFDGVGYFHVFNSSKALMQISVRNLDRTRPQEDKRELIQAGQSPRSCPSVYRLDAMAVPNGYWLEFDNSWQSAKNPSITRHFYYVSLKDVGQILISPLDFAVLADHAKNEDEWEDPASIRAREREIMPSLFSKGSETIPYQANVPSKSLEGTSDIMPSASVAGEWKLDKSDGYNTQQHWITLKNDGTYEKVMKGRAIGVGLAGATIEEGTWTATGMTVHLSGDKRFAPSTIDLTKWQRGR